MKKVIRNLFYLFFPLFIGGIISFIIKDAIDYNMIVKPILSPPSIVFPIAWTIIYFLMGLSYYLFKKKYPVNEDNTVTLYYTQLFFNAMWSFIFFLLKFRLLAIFWILVLDVLVISLVLNYLNKNRVSAYLNIIYVCWILFATYLTIGIYFLN